jgi:hypothetical protein
MTKNMPQSANIKRGQREWTFGLCLLCWLCGRDQSGKRHAGLVGRVAGLWLTLFALTAIVPPAPVFLPSNFDARNSNWCEILSTRHAGKSGVLSRGEIAQFQKTQQLLLQQEFAGLTPSRSDSPAWIGLAKESSLLSRR